MTATTDEIHNPRTGQRMRLDERDPAVLRIETINPPTAVPEPGHVHPRQESRAEVVSGTLRFVVAGKERRLGPGDSITIPAGVPHHFVSDGDEDAVSVQEFRPPLRTAEMLRALFRLAERGELDEHGMPSLLRLSLLGPEFGEEIRVVSPPWPVQRGVFAVLAPIARMRGYSAA